MIPKFRVWDTVNSVWFDAEAMAICEGQLFRSASSLDQWAWLEPDEYVLQLSTGLKDRHGVEIYVGDILTGQQQLTTDVMTPTKVNGIVKYSCENTMFYLDGKNSGHEKYMYSLGSSIYEYEVISNIYENQSLLEVAE